MLRLKLKEVLLAQGKKNPQAWLIENCKMNYSKTHKLLNNKQKSINYEDLSRICKALDCTPNELLWWENTPKISVNESHPLMAQLTKPDKDYNWTVRIQGLNPDRVEELRKYMVQLESEKQQTAQKIFEESKVLKNNEIEKDKENFEEDV